MIDPEEAQRLDAMGPTAVVDRFDELMHRSVQRMMIADAPVGALCSGGVDSSLLTAIAVRYHSNLAIFHADVAGHSEYDAASLVARHLKLDLKKVTTRDQDFIDLTPKIIYHYEWPYAWHPHSVPFLMVSELVRQSGVKAVLTGEGADECFLGYSYLAQKPLLDLYENGVRRLRALVRAIPRFGKILWPLHGEHALFISAALKQFERRLENRRIREIYAERMQTPAGRNAMTVEQLSGHIRTLLHRNDRMGMAASIEARFPFLDEGLVQEAINLPVRYKLRPSLRVSDRSHPFVRDKWVLRQLADRYLPKELAQRKKRGFDVSAFSRLDMQPAYFRNGYALDFLQMTAEEFDYLYRSVDQWTKIKLMMLEVWGEIFIQDQTVAASTERLKAHASLRAATT
jgi:asparagine synthase (glutamine-hydrolysing)